MVCEGHDAFFILFIELIINLKITALILKYYIRNLE